MDFEGKIKELETLVEKLGEGELSLNDSLKYFEKGVRLSRECLEHLNKSEEKVRKLIEVNTDGSTVIEDFEATT